MSDLFDRRKFKNYRVGRTSKESVEPEEILLDAQQPLDFQENCLELAIKPRVFKIFFGTIMAVLFFLAARSFDLQFIHGAQLVRANMQNSVRSYPIFAARGIIYDRDGKQLVFNVPSFDLAVSPLDLPVGEPRQKILRRVGELTGLANKDIEREIKNFNVEKAPAFILIDNLPHETVLKLEAEIKDLPGFFIEKGVARQYQDSVYFSHLLGYLGKLDDEDIKDNPDYSFVEKIGKNGLEAVYEKNLHGASGRLDIEVDALGAKKRETIGAAPADGESLILAVDGGLQRVIHDALEKAMRNIGARHASAVALNPKTGGILAMVSLPSFDNNLFAKGISAADYAGLINDPEHPLLNLAIAGQYSPGSTIKPIIASAALQEKVVIPETTVFSSGELLLRNQYNPAIVYRFGDWKAHGLVNLYSAIAESCDVYFYTIGGGYDKIEGLGVERLEKYLKLFGFGEKTGIDLPAEQGGLVPDPDWKGRLKKEAWFTGDTYHLSIGQGDLLVTPLQLAVATAAIANGGKVIVPHAVDKIVDSDKNVIKQIGAEVISDNFIDGKNLEAVRRGMRQTVTAGTARLLNDLSVEAAAKTGTAQVGGQKNSNAWFSAFAPYNDPEIVIVVTVENAGEGSQVAAPVAKEALKWYFNK